MSTPTAMEIAKKLQKNENDASRTIDVDRELLQKNSELWLTLIITANSTHQTFMSSTKYKEPVQFEIEMFQPLQNFEV